MRERTDACFMTHKQRGFRILHYREYHKYAQLSNKSKKYIFSKTYWVQILKKEKKRFKWWTFIFQPWPQWRILAINYPRNSLNLQKIGFLFIPTGHKMRIPIIDLALCLQLEFLGGTNGSLGLSPPAASCSPCDITKGWSPECVLAHAFSAENFDGLFRLIAVTLALTMKAIRSISKYAVNHTRAVISLLVK